MSNHTMLSGEYKRCARCGNCQPATPEYFYRNKSNSDGLHSYCKSCSSAYMRKWNKKHSRGGSKRVYQSSTTKTGKRAESFRKWRLAHPDYPRLWRAANPEKQRQYRETHKQKRREEDRRRRARELNSPGSHRLADIEIIRRNQRNRCWYCGADLSKTGEHLDHRIPLSRGGSDNASNLVLACPKCNLSKGSKLPHEWIGRLL